MLKPTFEAMNLRVEATRGPRTRRTKRVGIRDMDISLNNATKVETLLFQSSTGNRGVQEQENCFGRGGNTH